MFGGGGGGRLCVPPKFGMLRLVNEARAVAQACRPWARSLLLREGWPPAGLVVRGEEACGVCGQAFTALWVHRGVCVECEASLRARGLCPFDVNCRGGGEETGDASAPAQTKTPFCRHQGKCVRCEEVSCAVCRVHRLDGHGLRLLVDALGPTDLFLDFDQTLCNSKSGYAPVMGKHSLNPHLADLLLNRASRAWLPGTRGMRAQVVTRNSNVDAIVSFLAAKGFAAASPAAPPSRGAAIEGAVPPGGRGAAEIEVRCVKLERVSKADVVAAALAEPLSPGLGAVERVELGGGAGGERVLERRGVERPKEMRSGG